VVILKTRMGVSRSGLRNGCSNIVVRACRRFSGATTAVG
jgi:hypothetical protein